MKITNFKLQISNSQGGFTLVEMLAVMLVFGVVGAIAGAILVNSLRTSNKTGVLTNVKQNGDFAISQMSKVIRTSKAVISPFPCITPVVAKSMTFLASDNIQVTYTCTDISPTPTPPSVNSISSNSASLLDTNTISLVPNSCQFTCTQLYVSDYPLIGITFALIQKGSNVVEQQASASAIWFNTSITMRNLNRSL